MVKGIAAIGGCLIAAAPAAAAATIVPPEPIRMSTWIEPRDHPTEEADLGHEGTVLYRLSIDAGGRPVSCMIVDTSGWPVLDRTACVLMLSRARFTPARDASGTPIASTFDHRTEWRLSRAGSWVTPPQNGDAIEVSVSRLPNGGAGMVRVNQIVAADGTVESCTPARGGSDDPLTLIACDQAATRARPVIDRDGRPVRTLRTWQVRFTTQPMQEQTPFSGGPVFLAPDSRMASTAAGPTP